MINHTPPMTLRIAIGWDHAGIELAHSLIGAFPMIFWDQMNSNPEDPSMCYSKVAPFVLQRVYQGQWGVLICGTGMGMSISANRYPGIGAALCTDPHMAKMARAHNNANVLVLPGRLMSKYVAAACLSVFLKTPFDQGRHTHRIGVFDPLLAHSIWNTLPDCPTILPQHSDS